MFNCWLSRNMISKWIYTTHFKTIYAPYSFAIIKSGNYPAFKNGDVVKIINEKPTTATCLKDDVIQFVEWDDLILC